MTSMDTADREAEAEIQALIAHLELEQPIETPNNIGYSFYPKDLSQAARYFRLSLMDWSAAQQRLVAQGLLAPLGDGYRLTECGTQLAATLRRAPADLLLVCQQLPAQAGSLRLKANAEALDWTR